MADPIATRAARPPRRTITIFAVGLLLLDGVLLLVAAYLTRNWILATVGLVAIVLASGVLVYYRKYRKAIEEVRLAKTRLRSELEELRRLINERDRQA
jgi:hypothetical protein